MNYAILDDNNKCIAIMTGEEELNFPTHIKISSHDETKLGQYYNRDEKTWKSDIAEKTKPATRSGKK